MLINRHESLHRGSELTGDTSPAAERPQRRRGCKVQTVQACWVNPLWRTVGEMKSCLVWGARVFTPVPFVYTGAPGWTRRARRARRRRLSGRRKPSNECQTRRACVAGFVVWSGRGVGGSLGSSLPCSGEGGPHMSGRITKFLRIKLEEICWFCPPHSSPPHIVPF